ncbi:hypothetical protein [Lignipirellula cremea]|uniref:Leucine Rich repeats (2 copies) n=1 Tax=Lignipirellula cremea TaxID=2528010 RepID=A0A518DWV6_9BACT|nr:hypothetical protein [Lignipirellula cremea]QDU96320.1 hypothetical protein Pla8534_41400 [Lignipirellula cremea]
MRRTLFVLIMTLSQMSAGFAQAAEPAGPVGLEYRQRLPGVRMEKDEQGQVVYLEVANDKFTNADAVHIGRIPTLKSVSLFATAVTDDGMTFLQHLPHLESIAIIGLSLPDNTEKKCPFRGTGLAHLHPRAELTSVNFSTSEFGDPARNLLLKEKSLKSVFLIDSNMTQQGIDLLRQGLPDANIYGGKVFGTSFPGLSPAP